MMQCPQLFYILLLLHCICYTKLVALYQGFNKAKPTAGGDAIEVN